MCPSCPIISARRPCIYYYRQPQSPSPCHLPPLWTLSPHPPLSFPSPARSYYGYRALGSFEEDPRLRLMQARWFRGREVLDVGCNEGLVTLAVAAAFGCRRTTGVDIDGALVKRARRCGVCREGILCVWGGGR